MNHSKNNGTTHNVGLNGSALENNALNWNVQQGYGTDGVWYTGNANADYKGTYGEVTAGYGYDKDSDRLNYGLQGGIIAHADGVTFSQPLGGNQRAGESAGGERGGNPEPERGENRLAWLHRCQQSDAVPQKTTWR